ncbi:fimbria/pilus outer membrane usher protein [Stenotrophomonas rhizophila]|uniref:fimbria/pilus outer membrane usher protein n=1 Tax=Stenotrophomonas rhizophila TaxID=216778 RepID=UPI003390D366
MYVIGLSLGAGASALTPAITGGSGRGVICRRWRSTAPCFGPVVRGVARTNANVEIPQSGYVAYEASVAPGPFSRASAKWAAPLERSPVLVSPWALRGSVVAAPKSSSVRALAQSLVLQPSSPAF